MAPSQRGKRPLLSDVSNTVELVTQPIIQREKRVCRNNTKSIHIPEYKAAALSAEDISATQGVISEHVSHTYYKIKYIIPIVKCNRNVIIIYNKLTGRKSQKIIK